MMDVRLAVPFLVSLALALVNCGDDTRGALSVSPNPIAVVDGVEAPLVLTNTGTAPLVIDTFDVEGVPFVVREATPVTLRPGGSIELSLEAVDYEPCGTRDGRLSVGWHTLGGSERTDVPFAPDVLEAGVRLTPEDWSFGAVPVGSRRVRTGQIYNRGDCRFGVTDLLLSGSDDLTMSVALDLPFNVDPQTGVALEVVFAPTRAAAVEGVMLWRFDSETPEIHAVVEGEGR